MVVNWKIYSSDEKVLFSENGLHHNNEYNRLKTDCNRLRKYTAR
jgi:hypothetical protein